MNRRHMTLVLGDKEMNLLDQLADRRGMSKTAVLRGAAALYHYGDGTDRERREGFRRAPSHKEGKDRADGPMKELVDAVVLFNWTTGASGARRGVPGVSIKGISTTSSALAPLRSGRARRTARESIGSLTMVPGFWSVPRRPTRRNPMAWPKISSKTFKRDAVYVNELPSAAQVIVQLSAWFSTFPSRVCSWMRTNRRLHSYSHRGHPAEDLPLRIPTRRARLTTYPSVGRGSLGSGARRCRTCFTHYRDSSILRAEPTSRRGFMRNY